MFNENDTIIAEKAVYIILPFLFLLYYISD